MTQPLHRIRLKSDLIPGYPDDVARIVRIARDRGYDLNEAEAEAAWDIRSREWSAGWLKLGSDERVWAELLQYALEVQHGE